AVLLRVGAAEGRCVRVRFEVGQGGVAEGRRGGETWCEGRLRWSGGVAGRVGVAGGTGMVRTVSLSELTPDKLRAAIEKAHELPSSSSVAGLAHWLPCVSEGRTLIEPLEEPNPEVSQSQSLYKTRGWLLDWISRGSDDVDFEWGGAVALRELPEFAFVIWRRSGDGCPKEVNFGVDCFVMSDESPTTSMVRGNGIEEN
ncbi:hypothetical protein CYMTET_16417, partial [Cymbomonas tetramitiformis]